MWEFDPSQGSQPFRRAVGLRKKRANGPETRAFCVFCFVSRLPNRQSQDANRRKSPTTPSNIPIFERLPAETGFDHNCRPNRAVVFELTSLGKGLSIRSLLTNWHQYPQTELGICHNGSGSAACGKVHAWTNSSRTLRTLEIDITAVKPST
jgi:hypothetical protein